MASAGLRKQLECSICLILYTDPVTLRCGHNFCRVCIDQVLNTQEKSGVYSCPECREEFQERPALQKNITLCNVVENFLSTHRDDAGIFCTYCVDSPVPAVKSCLHCEASLCEKHLRFHSKGEEHVLTEPRTSLEKKKCSIHKKILEYYCTEDAACICVSCYLIGKHNGHKLESIDEASEKKKEKYRSVQKKLITKREETEGRVQSLEGRERKAHEKASGEAERVTALFIDTRRWLDDLEKRVLSEISKHEEQVSWSLSDVIQNLEIKKDELSRKMRDIEELCNITDPLTVLEDPEIGDLCDPEEEEGEKDTGGHDGGDKDTGVLCDHEAKGGNKNIGDSCGPEEAGHEDTDDLYDPEEEGDEYLEDLEDGSYEGSDFAYDPEEEGSDEDTDTTHESEEGNEDTDTTHESEEGNEDTDIAHESEEEGNEDTGDLCDPEEKEGDEDTGVQGDQGLELVSHVSHALSDIIRDITFYIQHPADILLDVNTACNNIISDDLKTATWTEETQGRPETAQRFQYNQMISSEGFTSGRHYWDVEIGVSEDWRVGMCYPSIDRKGHQSYIGDNNKSWGLCGGQWCNNQCSVMHDGKMIQLPPQISSNKVRVCLYYEAGQLSFYELCDPIRHLHTFTTTFTEPLHAVLCVIVGSIKISGGAAVRSDHDRENLPRDWLHDRGLDSIGGAFSQ